MLFREVIWRPVELIIPGVAIVLSLVPPHGLKTNLGSTWIVGLNTEGITSLVNPIVKAKARIEETDRGHGQALALLNVYVYWTK